MIGSGSVANPGPSWHVVGDSTPFEPAKADLTWQTDGNAIEFESDSGQAAIWQMNGTTLTSGTTLGNPGPSWHAIGVGDFNNDGRSDILWQNDSGEVAIWQMNGTTMIGDANFAVPGPDWHIMGTGDYNNDGKSDILWQNSSGAVAIWEMNGTNAIATTIIANPGPTWHA